MGDPLGIDVVLNRRYDAIFEFDRDYSVRDKSDSAVVPARVGER